MQCCANEVEDEEHFVLRHDKYKVYVQNFLNHMNFFHELSNAPDKEKSFLSDEELWLCIIYPLIKFPVHHRPNLEVWFNLL